MDHPAVDPVICVLGTGSSNGRRRLRLNGCRPVHENRSHGRKSNETMLIAEARVETERSSRYLVQLCQHVNHLAQAHPQMQAHVEWSDDRGVISFGWGRCTLRADPGTLTLRAEAGDEESLQRIERRVADHLERFGRRDDLAVTWTRSQGAGGQLPRQSPTRNRGGHAHG